jgi:hypothetical protein
MPISLRLPEYEEKLVNSLAKKTGRTKTAVILEAVSEKLGTSKNRKQLIRDLASWMPHDETEQLRSSLQHFNQVLEGDWD